MQRKPTVIGARTRVPDPGNPPEPSLGEEYAGWNGWGRLAFWVVLVLGLLVALWLSHAAHDVTAHTLDRLIG